MNANGTIWVYIFGEREGVDLKIGGTSKPTPGERLASVNREQTTSEEYVLLAAVLGQGKDETFLKKYFKDFRRTDKGTKREYFWPEPELVEYAAWLRAQWWAATDGTERADEHISEHSSHWLPDAVRRLAPPVSDETKIIQDWEAANGALPKPWAWFPNPRVSFQDYFTAPRVIEAARSAMGGIDLDAASHWAANRVHRIPDYFEETRSAFTHDWYGRVWLNPPYPTASGSNGPWFDRALHYIRSGAVEQLCMISPVWAFTTGLAKEFMEASSALVLLSPTPSFWRNEDEGEVLGSNHPHAVVYVGDRRESFLAAFRELGIAMSIDE